MVTQEKKLYNPAFQEFPKTYEDVRQRPFNQNSIAHNILSAWGPMELYTDKMREVGKRINDETWRMMVESLWLSLHFIYRGKRRKSLYANGDWYDKAWGFFMRTIVGYPNQSFMRSGWFYRVASYLNELYPDFLSRDPLADPGHFRFPYDTVTIDHMHLVYQMPDRMDLLRIAEERGMKFDEFFDYVINHMMCLNEQYKKDGQLYRLPQFGQSSNALYVRYLKFNKEPMRHINRPAKWRQKLYE